MKGRTFPLKYLLASLCLLFSSFAFAGLGESEESCSRELPPDHQIVDAGKYRIHVATGIEGGGISEYVTNSGIVFAFTWSGSSHHPNLEKFLGKHLGEYHAHASEFKRKAGPKVNRRTIQVKTENVVFEMGGHMRSVSGRMYVPSLFPAGVTANDIK